jgi:ribonuclease BN (tRNA processing enzyme)
LAEFLVNESRGEKLRICGPLGLERATRQLLAISYPEVNPDKFIAKSMAVFEVLTPTATVTFDDISLEVIPVVHGSIQSFGFYIQGGDASLFVSGDTVLCQEVLENVRKADYSIVDATTELERLPTHMNLDDLKNLQAKLSGSQHIFATHRTFLNDPLMSKVIFPNDFETYELRGKCKPLLIEER